ncbi:glycosyl transferase family 28 [Rhizobiales bacterium]|uniref:polysaccharide deacetylase family protein n=1 Tax=Hongsoonwoonella zoysiae TaxID=2821844 RepID=UPI001560521A|nr:polysaccharide deacetylase family protein [Hongsoonwoonella zoysiae]NRG19359.1 glycosyl transferase family 28 [Hongsoonwoonella zoysiae]
MSKAELRFFRDTLQGHLDWFAERGQKARFWWRDDDAVAPTPKLDRLLEIANRFEAQVALAVIPAAATPELAERLKNEAHAVVFQHGFRHVNHQRKDLGEKAAELGVRRDPDEAIAELKQGYDILEALFGERFLPALVPPWNRIAPAIVRRLLEAGLNGLSTFTWMHPYSRHQLQAHVDIIKWKKGRSFIGFHCAAIRYDLQLMRRRNAPDEPIGILTHHLDHDEACFEFLMELFSIIREHPGAEISPVRELVLPVGKKLPY